MSEAKSNAETKKEQKSSTRRRRQRKNPRSRIRTREKAGSHRQDPIPVLQDALDDAGSNPKPHFSATLDYYLDRLWESNPSIHRILRRSPDLERARSRLWDHLSQMERNLFDLDQESPAMDRVVVRDAIRVFRDILGPSSEKAAGLSSLEYLWRLARCDSTEIPSEISVGFMVEFINLFRAIGGQARLYDERYEEPGWEPDSLRLSGREAAEHRTQSLDEMGSRARKYLARYPSGLRHEIIDWRLDNRRRILRYFGATATDWRHYQWHLKNVIRDPKPLLDLIELTSEQKQAVAKATEHGIPFGITPYYLSLMDRDLSVGYDHSLRAQVIPPLKYVEAMVEHREDRSLAFDFMGEQHTSPIDLVTRRYPRIAILKPFNTCAQICVYCQRNWEIDEVLSPKALASRKSLQKALDWFDEHPSIQEVLVTGGDPCIMRDSRISWILEQLSAKQQIRRIRIGTRTPVVLPMRWSDSLAAILARFHQPGQREISVVTHFQHAYEVTPEAMEAVQKIRRHGMGVYNQAVFTVANSRRFELCALRRALRLIGVDPYYTFNMKGKDEMRQYRVPLARLLQERKEEARLLPGIDRTDEAVFNVPRLGKSHLRAGQDRRMIMIRPDGSRVYQFHPWEKNMTPVPPYNYVDVPIYDYLEELAARGENIREYRRIWFYY